ncbi:hypothetical protein ACFX1X_020635 [Malus domestica]
MLTICVLLTFRWKGFNFRVRPVNWVQIERKRHDKERTVEELKKFMEKIMKRDLKRQKKIEAAGIDYKCPEIEGGGEEPAPKKRKTDQKKVTILNSNHRKGNKKERSQNHLGMEDVHPIPKNHEFIHPPDTWPLEVFSCKGTDFCIKM